MRKQPEQQIVSETVHGLGSQAYLKRFQAICQGKRLLLNGKLFKAYSYVIG